MKLKKNAIFNLWAKAMTLLTDEPQKISNLLFFLNFFMKWAEASRNVQFFIFGQKQCLFFND